MTDDTSDDDVVEEIDSFDELVERYREVTTAAERREFRNRFLTEMMWTVMQETGFDPAPKDVVDIGTLDEDRIDVRERMLSRGLVELMDPE